MAGKHKILSQVFSEQIVYRFCMFSSVDCYLQETGTFAVNRHSTGQGWSFRTSQFDENIWEQSLHKHLHSWSPSQFESLSCLELCTWEAAVAFLLVDGAGCRSRQLPSSKSVLHWFVHQSTEKPDFPAMVLFMNEPCFTWEGIFSSHNSHVWAQANPLVASNNAMWSAFGRALCMTFWLGLLVTLTAQWTDLPCVSAAHFACQVWEHLTAT